MEIAFLNIMVLMGIVFTGFLLGKVMVWILDR